MLAILGLTKTALLGINATLLGGSMAQSQNVHEHVESLMRAKNAPRQAVAKQIATELLYNDGNWIRPLPASQRTVRGPHPQLVLLDEIDEMDYDVYSAAQGQAMAKPNVYDVVIPEMTIASSTWQNPVGTFKSVYDNAKKQKLSVHTWCWKETALTPDNPDGWLDPDFIERKRMSVPAEMFRVEYELGEPAGDSRAFDLTALKKSFTTNFTTTNQPVIKDNSDETWTFEKPNKHGLYAAGVDWAKTHDETVIVITRIDTTPWKTVYLRKLSRRPWPWMISEFNRVVNEYNAVSAHDATGLGNVVHDLVDERTMKVVMMGKDRIELLTKYITDVEKGTYEFPEAVGWFYDAHAGTTVDEVFAPGKFNSHLDDAVAAAAICHRAAVRQVQPVHGQVVLANEQDPALLTWQKQLNPPVKPQNEITAREAGVVQVKEPEADVGVFWIP